MEIYDYVLYLFLCVCNVLIGRKSEGVTSCFFYYFNVCLLVSAEKAEQKINKVRHIWRRMVSDCASILSDHKSHSTAAVHCFLFVCMTYLISKCPSEVKAHYFTDGCGGQ